MAIVLQLGSGNQFHRKEGGLLAHQVLGNTRFVPQPFQVVRASPLCDEINSSGVSVEVAANIARLDFKEDFVPATDDSTYSFDGTDDSIALGGYDMSNPFTFTINIKVGSLASSETVLAVGDGTNIFDLHFMSSGDLHILYGTSSFFKVKSDANYSTGNEIEVTFTSDGNEAGTNVMHINGVAQSGTSLEANGTSSNAGRIGIRQDGGTSFWFSGSATSTKRDNRQLTAQEVIDRFNGLAIPDKYKGANDFIFTAGAFPVAKAFRIVTIGTTDFTLIGASSNTIGIEFETTGPGTGTGTARSIGNTMDLAVGKTTGFWYDLDHDEILKGVNLIRG